MLCYEQLYKVNLILIKSIFTFCRCKKIKEAPYAVFKTPLPYNTSDLLNSYATGDSSDSDKSTSTRQPVTESPARRMHRKSQKTGHGCGSKNPSRGDTFTHARTRGKECKKHSTVVKSQIPTVTRTHTTAALKKMSKSPPSQRHSLVPSKKRDGKMKSTRESMSIYPTKKGVLQQLTSNTYPQTISTTKTIPSLTQKPTLKSNQLRAITVVTKTKKVSKPALCCGAGMLSRGDTFQPRCKSCLEQETHDTTVTPATTINALPVTLRRLQALQLKTTTEKPKENTRWNATTFSALKTAASLHKEGKPRGQMDSNLLQDNINEGPMGSTLAQGTHAERSLKHYNALHNMSGMCMHLPTPSLLLIRGTYSLHQD